MANPSGYRHFGYVPSVVPMHETPGARLFPSNGPTSAISNGGLNGGSCGCADPTSLSDTSLCKSPRQPTETLDPFNQSFRRYLDDKYRSTIYQRRNDPEYQAKAPCIKAFADGVSCSSDPIPIWWLQRNEACLSSDPSMAAELAHGKHQFSFQQVPSPSAIHCFDIVASLMMDTG